MCMKWFVLKRHRHKCVILACQTNGMKLTNGTLAVPVIPDLNHTEKKSV